MVLPREARAYKRAPLSPVQPNAPHPQGKNPFSAALKSLSPNLYDSVAAVTLVNEALLSGYFLAFDRRRNGLYLSSTAW